MASKQIVFAVFAPLALALSAFAGTEIERGASNDATDSPPNEELGLTLRAGYDSSFVFRGVEIGNHWVSSAVFLDMPVADTLKATLDANYGSLAGESDNPINSQSYQRLELSAGITWDAGAAELGIGYRWYHHMGDLASITEDGHEVGATIGSSIGPVNIGLGSFYDFAGGGWYLEAALNAEIRISDAFCIMPGANLGYAIDYTWHLRDFARDSFTHAGVSIAFPVKLSLRATLTPFVAANFPLDALDDSTARATTLYGGVSLSVKF